MEQELKVIPYVVPVSCEQLIRFHVLFYTHFNGIALSKGSLNALTLLGIRGRQPFLQFCQELAERKIFANVQSARNCIEKLEDLKLVYKEGTHKKMIHISEAMKISNQKNTSLEIKCVYGS